MNEQGNNLTTSSHQRTDQVNNKYDLPQDQDQHHKEYGRIQVSLIFVVR